MPRYIKYPVLALFVGAVIFFATGKQTPESEPVRSAVTVSQPNYLITDGNLRPPQ